MGKFEITQTETGCQFQLKAANGETIARSEVYDTMAACRKGMASVCKNAPAAKLEDQTDSACRELTNPKFQLYRDKAGQYRFRLRGRNGKIIAVSEGYTSHAACVAGIDSVRKNAEP